MSILRYLAAAAVLVASSSTLATKLPRVGITAGIPSTDQAVKFRKPFFQASFAFDYRGGLALLSSREDGTGATLVDDRLRVTVLRPDGTEVSFQINYFNAQCAGQIEQEPLDLSSYFQNGRNLVTVELWDACATAVGATPLWLGNF